MFTNNINVEWFETFGYLSKIKYVEKNKNTKNNVFLYFESKRQRIRIINENDDEIIFIHFSDSFR